MTAKPRKTAKRSTNIATARASNKTIVQINTGAPRRRRRPGAAGRTAPRRSAQAQQSQMLYPAGMFGAPSFPGQPFGGKIEIQLSEKPHVYNTPDGRDNPITLDPRIDGIISGFGMLAERVRQQELMAKQMAKQSRPMPAFFDSAPPGFFQAPPESPPEAPQARPASPQAVAQETFPIKLEKVETPALQPAPTIDMYPQTPPKPEKGSLASLHSATPSIPRSSAQKVPDSDDEDEPLEVEELPRVGKGRGFGGVTRYAPPKRLMYEDVTESEIQEIRRQVVAEEKERYFAQVAAAAAPPPVPEAPKPKRKYTRKPKITDPADA